MGTRNLTCVVLDKKFKVAQYGQWDGYPSGQGAIILRFLWSLKDLKKFTAKVRQLRWITDEELERRNLEFGIKPDQEWIDVDVADRRNAKYPELSRDTGGQILELIYRSEKPLQLMNNRDFAKDGLFCEWAYVVDLDKKTFEVYKGFKKAPPAKPERFCGPDTVMPDRKLADGKTKKEEYYPVQLVKSYSLKRLPTIKRMVKDCTPKEEE